MRLDGPQMDGTTCDGPLLPPRVTSLSFWLLNEATTLRDATYPSVGPHHQRTESELDDMGRSTTMVVDDLDGDKRKVQFK
jgi:hypothetical protein